jgi:hypothetical protein
MQYRSSTSLWWYPRHPGQRMSVEKIETNPKMTNPERTTMAINVFIYSKPLWAVFRPDNRKDQQMLSAY